MILCVPCLGVSFTFCVSRICLFRFRLLSGHLLVKSCSFGQSLCLFLTLVVSHFDSEGGTLVLIVSVPARCLPFTIRT